MSCAIALAKFPDIQVDIYESAAELSEVGAGIGTWPRAWDVLQRLELATDLLETASFAQTEGDDMYELSSTSLTYLQTTSSVFAKATNLMGITSGVLHVQVR